MIIDFSNLKSLRIPEGEVVSISRQHNKELLWKNTTLNWVPYSIDTDKSIYNGIGYKEGYRLSSSGELKTQANSVATGFIPANTDSLITMSGVVWPPAVSSGYTYICFYDKNFTKLAHINAYTGQTGNGVSNMTSGTVLNSSASSHNITKDENGIYTFNLTYQSGASFAYIRISAEGLGSNMVINIA